MNANGLLAPHELAELHELLAGEVVCLQKMQLSLSVVSDPKLQSLLQQTLAAKQTRLGELQQIAGKQAGAIHPG